MNLLLDEPRDVATRVKLRIMAKGPQRVYVRDSGITAILPPTDKRCEERPDSHLVGSYNRRASLLDIEADLLERRRELGACCEGRL